MEEGTGERREGGEREGGGEREEERGRRGERREEGGGDRGGEREEGEGEEDGVCVTFSLVCRLFRRLSEIFLSGDRELRD